MKKLLFAISITSLLMSCESNSGFKSSRRAQSSVISPKAKTQTVSGSSVSRLNEPIPPAQPSDRNLARLDSIVNAGTERLPYDRAGVMTPGVSGAGSGGSYASVYYAGEKRRKASAATQTAAITPISNANRIIAMADSATASQTSSKADTSGLKW